MRVQNFAQGQFGNEQLAAQTADGESCTGCRFRSRVGEECKRPRGFRLSLPCHKDDRGEDKHVIWVKLDPKESN